MVNMCTKLRTNDKVQIQESQLPTGRIIQKYINKNTKTKTKIQAEKTTSNVKNRQKKLTDFL